MKQTIIYKRQFYHYILNIQVFAALTNLHHLTYQRVPKQVDHNFSPWWTVNGVKRNRRQVCPVKYIKSLFL